MKIAVFGLGGIAQKVYLPLFSAMQDKLEVYLVSRDEKKAMFLQEKYGFSGIEKDLPSVLQKDFQAAFVHTATQPHFAYCKALISQGIPTYVDKPISENIAEVEYLIQLAKEKQVPFYVGFNRRYVPLLHPLKEASCDHFYLQKNRIKTSGTTTFQAYDLFIHLMDTALYLMDELPQLKYATIKEEKKEALYMSVLLENSRQSAFLTCNFSSGANEEIFQGESATGTYRLTNLVTLEKNTSKKEIIVPGDWESPLDVRGFKGVVTDFLQAVSGNGPLLQEKVLGSHELISEMLLTKR